MKFHEAFAELLKGKAITRKGYGNNEFRVLLSAKKELMYKCNDKFNPQFFGSDFFGLKESDLASNDWKVYEEKILFKDVLEGQEFVSPYTRGTFIKIPTVTVGKKTFNSISDNGVAVLYENDCVVNKQC